MALLSDLPGLCLTVPLFTRVRGGMGWGKGWDGFGQGVGWVRARGGMFFKFSLLNWNKDFALSGYIFQMIAGQ